MKNKVLKLCKRLNKVTASEIAPILMITEAEAREILNKLVKEGSLTVREDLVYFYKEIQTKPTLPLFFEFHNNDEIELIIKCFCLNIEVIKVIKLVKSQKHAINKFYRYFRNKIYENQMNELLEYINKSPYLPQEREYLGRKYYLYVYNKKLFVSEKYIVNKDSIKYSNQDRLLIKNLFLNANRKVLNNSYKQYYHLHLAEEIWRYNKDFEKMYEEIKSIMYNHT